MFNISSNLTITNSIFWLNEDSSGTNESAQIFGDTPIINYSFIQGYDLDLEKMCVLLNKCLAKPISKYKKK